MKIYAAALLLVCACSSPPKPRPPSNQPTEVADQPREPKPVKPPDVTVTIVGGAGVRPGNGSVKGTLGDTSGEGVIGATVVASSPALQGSQTAITDEQGWFQVVDLPVGSYQITVYYNDLTFQHPIEIVDGKVTELRVTNWNIAAPQGEIILIR